MNFWNVKFIEQPVLLSTYTFGIHFKRKISLQKLISETRIVHIKYAIKHIRNSWLSAWQFAFHMRKYILSNLSVTHTHTMLVKVKSPFLACNLQKFRNRFYSKIFCLFVWIFKSVRKHYIFEHTYFSENFSHFICQNCQKQ